MRRRRLMLFWIQPRLNGEPEVDVAPTGGHGTRWGDRNTLHHPFRPYRLRAIATSVAPHPTKHSLGRASASPQIAARTRNRMRQRLI